MPEMNISARDTHKGDVVLVGGSHCTVTTSEEWNERLWKLCFKDGSMLYLLHSHRLDVERVDPDTELVEAMAQAIYESDDNDQWPGTSSAEAYRNNARAALAAYRTHEACPTVRLCADLRKAVAGDD